MYHLLLVLFWISKSWARNEIDYCKINKDHILCGADVPPSKISNVLRYFPKTNKEREDLLNAINQMRNLAAGGGFRIGNVSFPTAGDMYELEWCEICEKAALNKLKKCSTRYLPSCCNCMNTGDTDLFSASLSEKIPDVRDYPFNLTSIFEHFKRYNAIEYIPLDCVRKNTDVCLRGASGFHFHLINARLVKIGCAFGDCVKNAGEKGVFGVLTCFTNLDYEADIENKKQYTVGKPASKCPRPYSSKSTKYPNLCKCRNITECLIKPAELSSKCTTRKIIYSTLLPSTKQVVGSEAQDT